MLSVNAPVDYKPSDAGYVHRLNFLFNLTNIIF